MREPYSTGEPKDYDEFDRHAPFTEFEIARGVCLCNSLIVEKDGMFNCSNPCCGRYLNINPALKWIPALQSF